MGDTTLDQRMGPLLEALEQTDKGVVRRAVEELVALAVAEPRVADILDRRLRAAPRWPVAYALGQMVRPSTLCLDVLAHGLGSGDQDLRWATQLLLTDLGKRYPEVEGCLETLLRDGSATQRRMAVYCLRDIHEGQDAGHAGIGRAPVFLEAMRDPEPLVRVAVVTSLAKTTEVSAETLDALTRAATDDADARVRNAAAFAVKKLAGVRTKTP